METPATQAPGFDEAAARAKLTASKKYTPEQVDTYIQAKKTNPGIFTQKQSQPQPGTDLSAANFGQAVKTDAKDTSVLGDFGKSFYNGVVPELMKGLSDLPKLVMDATGNSSDWYNHINKVANDGIDKYLTFDIPAEYNQGILGGPRSFFNALGGMLGTVAGVAGMAAIGDEPGAAEGLVTLGSKVKNLAAFTSYMIDPIYQSGKRAGLSDTDNARMTLALAPAVSSASMLSELWGPGLANKLMGKEIAGGITEGVEAELKGLAEGEITPETFKLAAKNASTKMIDNMKNLSNSPVLKEAAKAGGAGYLMGAIQQGGEQLYDTMFADKDATTGQGKYGTDLFSKESFKSDMSNALLGGLLGGAMGSFHASPMVDESIYGYLDGAIQKDEATGKKAIDRLNKVTDGLVQQGTLTPEQAQVVKDKIGKIKATADTFAKLKDVGTPIDAETRYEAYNLQNNVKQDIIDKGIKPYEATKADHDRMQLELDAERDGAPLDPSINPAAVGKMAEILKNSEPEYKSAQEKVAAIDTYLNELGKTGQRGDITGILRGIDEKYNPAPRPPEGEANAAEPTLPDTEVKGDAVQKHFDSLGPEDLQQQHKIVSDEVAGAEQHIATLKDDNIDGSWDEEIAAGEKNLEAKKTDLEYLNNLITDKTKTNEKTNSRLAPGEEHAGAQREEVGSDEREADATVSAGTGHDGQQEGRKPNQERVSAIYNKAGKEVANDYFSAKLKKAVKEDYEGLLEKMINDGVIKEVPCR